MSLSEALRSNEASSPTGAAEVPMGWAISVEQPDDFGLHLPCASHRRRRPPGSTFAVRAKLNKFVVNFGRKSEATPAPVYQEVVQIMCQIDIVLPQTSDSVRNSREFLK